MYRIMLADDEGIMLEALKNIITSNFGGECEIATAKTGRAVVELAERFRPDIAFMDIQMPGLNGYDTARMIRHLERADAKTIPIIAMTANAFAEDVQAALEAGMNAHVAKPIDMDILRSALGRVLKSNLSGTGESGPGDPVEVQ